LLVFDADEPEKLIRAIPLDKAEVYSLTWADNGRLLLTVVLKQNVAGEELPYLRLLAIDVDAGGARVLDRKSQGIYAGDVLYADPTGSWALVASQNDVFNYPSVKKVDLATGDATVVEKSREDVWDWYADDKGVVRAGIAYSGRRWTVWYREKPEEKLHAVSGKFDKTTIAPSTSSSSAATRAGS
jgi:hypothetical protein